jgi:hypothetical protein
MALSSKAAINLIKTCAAAVTLGVALAPSNALAVTTWNWSFATTIADQFGSGTFTTADVVPTAGTTYQITGVSGTYNRGGTAYTITGLETSWRNQFQWNGTTTSPILIDFTDTEYKLAPRFNLTGIQYINLIQNSAMGFNPVNETYANGFFGADGSITSSSLAPVSAPTSAVPGPLPLLGAVAAFQASRRLRRRRNGSLPAA